MSTASTASTASPSRERIVYGTGRETLLAAAVQVASDKGLAALTYREVAREAGVAHSLVAHHFGSRNSLIRATMEYAVQVGSQTIHFSGGSLDELGDDLDELVQDTPGLQAFQIELAINARTDPALGESARAMYDRYIRLTRDDLERLGLGDDPAIARLVMAALDGIVIQQLVYDSPEQTRESLEALRGVIASLSERRASQSRDESTPTHRGAEAHDRLHDRHRSSPRHRPGHRREALG